LRLSKVSF